MTLIPETTIADSDSDATRELTVLRLVSEGTTPDATRSAPDAQRADSATPPGPGRDTHLGAPSERQSALSQRQIARSAGLSLGMTNKVLARLSKKGYLTMRKVKGRHMAYAVTPEGVQEIARRTYRYFRRTMDHVAHYKDQVDVLTRTARERGYTRMQLVGKSDLDFLLEYACAQNGIALSKVKPGAEEPGRAFIVAGERLGSPADRSAPASGVEAHQSLWELVTGVEPEAETT